MASENPFNTWLLSLSWDYSVTSTVIGLRTINMHTTETDPLRNTLCNVFKGGPSNKIPMRPIWGHILEWVLPGDWTSFAHGLLPCPQPGHALCRPPVSPALQMSFSPAWKLLSIVWAKYSPYFQFWCDYRKGAGGRVSICSLAFPNSSMTLRTQTMTAVSWHYPTGFLPLSYDYLSCGVPLHAHCPLVPWSCFLWVKLSFD